MLKKRWLIFISFLLAFTLLIPTAASASEKNYKPDIALEPIENSEGNEHPIILVHGLGGFGRDELGGIIKMWGGIHDIEKKLREKGYKVYTAAVGPVSSNRDRAIELYYQIKGGTVDYGEAHAKKYGHDRYGRTYPGFYPEWGEINPKTGKPNKVHLIGHSMGGQTIRTLAQLLYEGDPEEQKNGGNDISPLLSDEKQPWLHSVLSISSPHDGSTATYNVNDVIPIIQELVIGAGNFAGNIDQNLYDFKLDHWGIKKRPGESFHSYVQRVRNSPVWKTKDTANWDLKPEGAYELNRWVKAQPDVYYFSVSNTQSRRSLLTGYYVPDLFMNPFLHPTAYYIGSKTFRKSNFVLDKTWWENDGLVSVKAMKGPNIGSNDVIVEYNGTPRKGVWNHLGTMRQFDHLDIIGWGVRDVTSWYEDVARFLFSLPDDQ